MNVNYSTKNEKIKHIHELLTIHELFKKFSAITGSDKLSSY